MGHGVLCRSVGEARDDLLGQVRVPLLLQRRAEARQSQGRQRVGGGQVAVLRRLVAHEDVCVASGGEEESALLPVQTVLDHGLRQKGAVVEPVPCLLLASLGLDGGAVELRHAPQQRRVIAGQGGDIRAVAPAAKPAGLPVQERLLEEKGRALRKLPPIGAIKGGGGAGQRADHEPIPAHQDLRVAGRGRSTLPRFEEARARVGQLLRRVLGPQAEPPGQLRNGGGLVQDVVADLGTSQLVPEVAPRHDGVGRAEQARLAVRQQGPNLVVAPQVVAPFAVGALRVDGGVKGRGGVRQVPGDEADDVLCHRPVEGVGPHFLGKSSRQEERGLGGEEFLEVGGDPAFVRRVAGKTAPQVVVDAAPPHAPQRQVHHGEGFIPLLLGVEGRARLLEQEEELRDLRKLRGRPEAAPVHVEGAAQGVQGLARRRGPHAPLPGQPAAKLKQGRQVLRRPQDVLPLHQPEPLDAGQDVRYTGHLSRRALGQPRGGEEGASVWRQKQVEGPAP